MLTCGSELECESESFNLWPQKSEQSWRELVWAAANCRPSTEDSLLRSRTNAKCGLEDNTTWYGQEKMWVNVAVCLCLPDSVSLPDHRSFNPFQE